MKIQLNSKHYEKIKNIYSLLYKKVKEGEKNHIQTVYRKINHVITSPPTKFNYNF